VAILDWKIFIECLQLSRKSLLSGHSSVGGLYRLVTQQGWVRFTPLESKKLDKCRFIWSWFSDKLNVFNSLHLLEWEVFIKGVTLSGKSLLKGHTWVGSLYWGGHTWVGSLYWVVTLEWEVFIEGVTLEWEVFIEGGGHTWMGSLYWGVKLEWEVFIEGSYLNGKSLLRGESLLRGHTWVGSLYWVVTLELEVFTEWSNLSGKCCVICVVMHYTTQQVKVSFSQIECSKLYKGGFNWSRFANKANVLAPLSFVGKEIRESSNHRTTKMIN